MVKKLLPFAKDLVGDGYVLVGIFAPLLSIAFTIAKAFDMPELSHLREISYAWALAPLLLWVFIAYVRRRSHTLQSSLKLSFGMNEAGCVRRDVTFHAGDGRSFQVTWFKLKVSAIGATNIVGCRAHLTLVKRVGECKNLLDGEYIARPFSPATDGDAERKEIRPAIPQHVPFPRHG